MLTEILNIFSLISLGTVLFVLIVLWALWVLYVAMMNVQRASTIDRLPWQAKILVIPTMGVFNIVEFVANVIVCTLLFLDWPRELTVSDRLRRYVRKKTTPKWRLSIVYFIKPMIDPFDHRGPHI